MLCPGCALLRGILPWWQAHLTGGTGPTMTDSSHSCVAAPVEPAALVSEPEPPTPGVWGRMKRFFGGDRIDRQRLAALGMGAVCSYGLISNVTYGGGMAVGGAARRCR